MTPKGTTILFVDDEVDLTEKAKEFLPLKGFTVHVANSADGALDIIREGVVPDILCTDIVMPGGSGVVLAKDVQALIPAIKVLLITGRDEQVLPQNKRGGHSVLGKPYLFSTLVRILESI